MVFNQVAAALGMDPVAVAIKNDGAHGHDMAWLNQRKAEMGFEVRDSLQECIAKGSKAIDWEKMAPAGRQKTIRWQISRHGHDLDSRMGRFRRFRRNCHHDRT